MNYLDLFSGCGGFHLGLERAGFKFNWVGHSEVDKYACQVYHNHWRESECLGDVKSIRPNRLPERIDLITFGFPCQDLSVAGKRGGLHASRSGLFFEAMRLVEAAKPEVFIFENVKGLLSSSEGRDIEVVLRTIADLGLYDCEWQLVNTRWVLPQNRERIYFIGHLRGRSRPKVFPFREGIEDAGRERKGFESGQFCQSLDSSYYKGPDGKRTVIAIETPALPWKSRNQHTAQDEMLCLRTVEPHGVLYDSKIRRLTPTECARLQGFPCNHHKGLSDTQAYRIYGNAVTVDIVEMIGRRLLQ